MGFGNFVRSQFLDTIEYVDLSKKVLVYKYQRPSGDNEIKQGAQVIVREGQAAIFLSKGRIADIFSPGTYVLNTSNLPILSSFAAIGHLFNSPIKADLYYVSTNQLIDNKWATKNPVIIRDPEFNMVRCRAFGQFAFRITDPKLFMQEIFGSKGIVFTWDIVQYLAGLVAEAFAITIAESQLSILDLGARYRELGNVIQDTLNQKANDMGLQFTNIIVENISLPDEVEKYIDEQSGIGMASRNMDTFIQYQSARAIRDAAKQKNGLAGLGAGLQVGKVVGNTMANGMGSLTEPAAQSNSSIVDKLRQYKELMDEGVLTPEEFNEMKAKLLRENH